TDDTPDPEFTTVIELDMSTLEPSLAGPKRPQDRIPLRDSRRGFQEALESVYHVDGGGATATQVAVTLNGKKTAITHGSVVIAAITSCTNTSIPSVMIGAGLLAKKAVERGLTVPPYVKTSLAPGSRVVTRYLEKAGVTPHLRSEERRGG